MIELRGQSAVVVGATSGMGRAIAKALRSEGMQVVAAGRRKDALAELESEAAVSTLACDVTSRTDVECLIEESLRRLSKIDLLVYASGTNIPERSMAELPAETWDEMLAVNLTGAFNVTKAVLPSMRAAGGGHLVYISSISAHWADAVSGAAYQAAKRGLSGLAHATRLEERKHGLRACVLFPGLCDTAILQKRPQPPGPDVLAHALRPEDVADAVVAVARLHPRVAVPELEIVPARLQ
ncbi:MAG TPA: SDR family oxidoreductase [Planctomycetota bacterium]|nr:SDR family oxidoreductase [Planctomycetota bacterium]